MSALPSGTVTFLFTDIEGPTRLLRRLGGRYEEVLERHDHLVRAACVDHGGREIDTQGDAFFVAFARAGAAVAAAVQVQRALAAERWPRDASVRVRMGLHTASRSSARRITSASRSIGPPGSARWDMVARFCRRARRGSCLEDDLRPGISYRDLGPQRLKDLDRSVV